MTPTQQLDPMPVLAAFAGTALVALVIWLVVVPIGLSGVFGALGEPRSRAWIPFANLARVYRLGGFSEFWLIALVVPPVSIVGWVVLLVASHNINRRLGKGAGFTVLAVLLWWVWALAVGLGRPVDRAPSRAGAAPVVFEVRPSASGWVSPAPSPHLPAGASIPAPPPAQVPPPPQVDSDVPRAQLPPLPPVAPVAPRTETPPAAQPTVPIAPLPPVPPLPPIDSGAARGQIPPAPAPDDDDATVITTRARAVPDADATVISPRRRGWAVVAEGGQRAPLSGGAALLGRTPASHPSYPHAQFVTLTDAARSVSGTHALLELVDGVWHITDLGSTNGVWLVDPETGAQSELPAHTRAPVTAEFQLGELKVQVVQGG